MSKQTKNGNVIDKKNSPPPTEKSAILTREMEKPPKIGTKLIHPIIMYPYSQPPNYDNLEALYDELVKNLAENNTSFSQHHIRTNTTYARPITVINRQTFHNNARYKYDESWKKNFIGFRQNFVEKYSDILDVWSVDTCQMWLSAFGKAYDNKFSGEDVYWLIPGDFDYASTPGQEVLKMVEKIPDAVMTRDQDLCVGEIAVPVNSSKQLIDTYGTYGLLYNWFPHEAQEIRKVT